MALPPGINAITATTGPWIKPDGSFAMGRATISVPINNVYLPTGSPMASGDMTLILTNGAAVWHLCPTDQDGLLESGNWQYTLRVELAGATVQPPPVKFSLLQGGPASVDLDNLGSTVVPSTVGLVGSALVGFSTIAA